MILNVTPISLQWMFTKKIILNKLIPEKQLVLLEGNDDHITMVYFPFINQLKSLLDNKILNRKENLVINAQDPFGKYNSDDGLLGEVLTGSWYNKAYNNLFMDQNKDFLCPIIAYCDACQISDKSQYGAHSFKSS